MNKCNENEPMQILNAFFTVCCYTSRIAGMEMRSLTCSNFTKISVGVGIIEVTWAWCHDLRFKHLDHPVHGWSLFWTRRNTLNSN